MHRRGDGHKALFLGVAVEAGDGSQPARHGGPGAPGLFERPDVQLDVCTAHGEKLQAVALAPGDELAEVEGLGVPGQASVAGQEAGQGEAFGVGEDEVGDGDRG
jgi:hypothetical protein